jgi:hypothetical protein
MDWSDLWLFGAGALAGWAFRPKAKQSNTQEKSFIVPIASAHDRDNILRTYIREISNVAFSENIALRVCGLISEGLSLRKIEKLEGMLTKSAIMMWLLEGEAYKANEKADHPKTVFLDHYARALSIRDKVRSRRSDWWRHFAPACTRRRISGSCGKRFKEGKPSPEDLVIRDV